MWKQFWQRKPCAAFILTSAKRGTTTVSLDELTGNKLKSLLEDHAYALHFTGPEEELLATLRRLAPAESMNVRQWRVIRGTGQEPMAQVRLTGPREIRRLIRLITAAT